MADRAAVGEEAASDGNELVNGDDVSRLNDLIAQATHQYSLNNCEVAAELYAHATGLQAEINGEMSTRNADLLYAYGRCLYHVAVQKSDVLGSKVAEDKPKSGPPKNDNQAKADVGQSKFEDINEAVVTTAVEGKEGPLNPPYDAGKTEKTFFQFKGDENFDMSEEEREEDEEDAADAEDDEEDDFANAFEVLDMARILLLKRIQEDSGVGKGKSPDDSPNKRQLQERLADTHDLQAEISLEGERFANAVEDLKSALHLKEKLYPPWSSLLAEAHYKLSLALEFSSVTEQQVENKSKFAGKGGFVDYGMREEAAREMEAAIGSCKGRIGREQATVVKNGSADHALRPTTDIADVKEMVLDMEQRLSELRQPPFSINDPRGIGTVDGSTPLAGILGSMLGESPDAQKVRLEEAARDAKDLSGFVKKKKLASESPLTGAPVSDGSVSNKRESESVAADSEAPGKRYKVDDAS